MTQNALAKKILIIEDDQLMTTLLQEILEIHGYHVANAEGQEDDALDSIENDHYDLAILDVNLKGPLSYGIADKLAAKKIPFIFSTGYEAESLPPEYHDYPILQKPYDLKQLPILIDQLTSIAS